MFKASELLAHINKFAPATGVSVVDDKDLSKCRIHFTDDATPEQRAAAQAELRYFTPPEEKPPVDADALAELLENKGVLSKQDVAAVRKPKGR